MPQAVSQPRVSPCPLQLYLRELLRLMHPRFHQHLCALGEDGLQMLFCHRWILLCFKREFPEAEALRMWEACWAHYQVRHVPLSTQPQLPGCPEGLFTAKSQNKPGLGLWQRLVCVAGGWSPACLSSLGMPGLHTELFQEMLNTHL